MINLILRNCCRIHFTKLSSNMFSDVLNPRSFFGVTCRYSSMLRVVDSKDIRITSVNCRSHVQKML